MGRVDLEQVSRILLLYSQALAGTTLQIVSCKNPEWLIHPNMPTGDGTTIFLPLYVDRYNSSEENFTWYKVSATHQAGHIEFGTLNFSFEKATSLFTKQRQRPPINDVNLTDVETFFALFDDRKLAVDIFTAVEDIRIDYLVKQEYAGIRDAYQRIQLEFLASRPPISSLFSREALLEILTQRALGSEPQMIPSSLNSLFQSAIQVVQSVQSPETTVYDSVEATLRLYDILSSIHNQKTTKGKELANDLDSDDNEVITVDDDILNFWENKIKSSHSEETTLPYQSFVKAEADGNSDAKPISLEDVKRFVKRGLDPTEVIRNNFPSSGFYVAELLSSGTPGMLSGKQYENICMPRITTLAETPKDEVLSFLYDEWNFRTCSYMPRWCRVREIPLQSGNASYFRETLAHNSQLAMQLRKQFEKLAPQELIKLTKLQDGEEFDLDAVIETVQERKAGRKPNEKVYTRRIRPRRDVVVVFLIDMSASTSDVIKDTDEKPHPKVFSSNEMPKRPTRVIDVAKESVVLMISALEILRDCYGVYGFSSSGRDNVELRVIKGLDETFSATIEGRVEKIRPLFSTRMGPAIRYATSKLETRNEKTKILFLVSDGYPQDRDYGLDSEDKEYALRDTEMAFIEAKRKDIVPFCLTVDATGRDFLKEMSHHIEHQVIRDIKSLPQHLPNLYRRLTS